MATFDSTKTDLGNLLDEVVEGHSGWRAAFFVE
jgi:hypothetical protein